MTMGDNDNGATGDEVDMATTTTMATSDNNDDGEGTTGDDAMGYDSNNDGDG